MKKGILAPWHDATEAGQLRFPRCDDCSAWNWYPLPRCRHCGSNSFQWTAVRPLGVLYSWTRVHHVFGEQAAAPLPYVTGIVDIQDAPGVRLACLNWRDQADPRIGATVRLDLEQAKSGARWLFKLTTPP
jgi:uncharacterized OB-fold protein